MKKTAIVTGGASGIGQKTAQNLHAQGWDVWCLDLNVPDPSVRVEMSSGVSYLQCNVADPQSVRAAVSFITQSVNKIDALICSAGVLRTGSLIDQAPDEVDLMMSVNLKGPWLMVREFVHLLKKNSSPDSPSRVVFVGSISGIRPKVGAGFYAASKAALHVLTGVLAVELAADGILVNAVAPGTVDTPMISAATKSDAAVTYQPSGDSPLGRIATVDDVSNVILLFLDNSTKYVTGTVLPVDGGTRAAFLPK